MKQLRNISALILATTFILFATASTARADERLIANVPFPFVVGDTRLPAGRYIVKVVSEDLHIWAITSDKGHGGHQSVLVDTIPAWSPRTPTTPELVFDRFENQYFLARVAPDGEDPREIPLTPAKMEHEVVKLALRP